jgi:hypothetical protein
MTRALYADYRVFAIEAFNNAVKRMDLKLHALTLYLDPRYKVLLWDQGPAIWHTLRSTVCNRKRFNLHWPTHHAFMSQPL